MPSARRLFGLPVALCVLVAALAAASASPQPASGLAFGTPVNVGGGAEPGIQVDPVSGAYYAASADNVWRSDDKGATWKRVTPRQIFAGDANVAIGSTGNVYYQSLWVGSSWAWTSFDKGQTWPIETPFSTNLYADRNWIAAYGPYTVYAKADLFASVLQTPLIYKSVDAGVTFYPVPGIAHGLISDSGGIKGALTVDPRSGALYMPADWAHNVVSSVDGGDTLRVAHVPNPFGESYDIILTTSVDSAGNVYLAWISDHGGRWTLQYSYSKDQGLTWSQPNVVASGGGASRVFPWSAANGTGRLAIAWYETDASSASPDDVPNDAPWKVRVAQVLNAPSGAPQVTIVNATDVIHRGKICTQGVTCASGTRNLLDFLGIAIDPSDGRAVIVYTSDLGRPPTVQFVRQTTGPTW